MIITVTRNSITETAVTLPHATIGEEMSGGIEDAIRNITKTESVTGDAVVGIGSITKAADRLGTLVCQKAKVLHPPDATVAGDIVTTSIPIDTAITMTRTIRVEKIEGTEAVVEALTMTMIDQEQRDKMGEIGTVMITIEAEGITEMNRHNIVITIESVVVMIHQIAETEIGK